MSNDEHEVIIIQLAQFLNGHLHEGRIVAGVIKEGLRSDIKVVADLQELAHRRQALSGGNVVDIAAAVSQIIAHLIFRNPLL